MMKQLLNWIRRTLDHDLSHDIVEYNHWGYIDKNGKIVIPCQWERADEFNGEKLFRVT